MNLLVHFVIYGHSWCFENFQNITRAHKSRNALAFIRFPILIATFSMELRTRGLGHQWHTEIFITSLCFRYEIMTKCWWDDPNLRLPFEKLGSKLRETEYQHKVELKSLQRDSLSPYIYIYIFKSKRLNLSPSNLLDNGVKEKASKRSSWF